jgi:hypothetical protein
MFHNLIRVFHDGIILTEPDKIVFKNNKIMDILNIDEQDIRITKNAEGDEEQYGPPVDKNNSSELAIE